MSQQRPKASIISRRVYTNDIPIAELSCPPKFMRIHFNELERYAKCDISKLEEDYTYEVVPEDILRHCPPLVDVSVFKRPENVELHPLDALLLDDDFGTPAGSKRSQQHNRVVPWMRKTEYISTEFNRFGVTQDRSESKIGYKMRKMGQRENLYRDPAAQIQAIERTFEKANKPVKKHYSKPGVHAVEELYILPDESQWKYSFAQVIFDGEPLPNSKNCEELQSRAMLKGIKDDRGQHFVAYFHPTPETLEKYREEEQSGEEPNHDTQYTTVLAREFNWNLQTRMSKGSALEIYFFTERDGALYYGEMDTKVRLNRRQKTMAKETSLVFTNRELTANEEQLLRKRDRSLYDPYKTGVKIPLEEEEEEAEQEEREVEEEESEAAAKNPFDNASDDDDDDKKSKSSASSSEDEAAQAKQSVSKAAGAKSSSDSGSDDASAKSSSSESSSDDDAD